MTTPRLAEYLRLEAEMQRMNDERDPAADSRLDVLDRLWYGMKDEERAFLDGRGMACPNPRCSAWNCENPACKVPTTPLPHRDERGHCQWPGSLTPSGCPACRTEAMDAASAARLNEAECITENWRSRALVAEESVRDFHAQLPGRLDALEERAESAEASVTRLHEGLVDARDSLLLVPHAKYGRAIDAIDAALAPPIAPTRHRR